MKLHEVTDNPRDVASRLIKQFGSKKIGRDRDYGGRNASTNEPDHDSPERYVKQGFEAEYMWDTRKGPKWVVFPVGSKNTEHTQYIIASTAQDALDVALGIKHNSRRLEKKRKKPRKLSQVIKNALQDPQPLTHSIRKPMRKKTTYHNLKPTTTQAGVDITQDQSYKKGSHPA